MVYILFCITSQSNKEKRNKEQRRFISPNVYCLLLFSILLDLSLITGIRHDCVEETRNNNMTSKRVRYQDWWNTKIQQQKLIKPQLTSNKSANDYIVCFCGTQSISYVWFYLIIICQFIVMKDHNWVADNTAVLGIGETLDLKS